MSLLNNAMRRAGIPTGADVFADKARQPPPAVPAQTEPPAPTHRLQAVTADAVAPVAPAPRETFEPLVTEAPAVTLPPIAPMTPVPVQEATTPVDASLAIHQVYSQPPTAPLATVEPPKAEPLSMYPAAPMRFEIWPETSDLFANLSSLVPMTSPRVIMIVGAEPDVGAEAIGQQLAALAMLRGIGPALVVDCEAQRGVRQPGLLEQLDMRQPLTMAAHAMTGAAQVMHASLARNPMRLQAMTAADCRSIVNEVRREFALTILLGSMNTGDADFLMMSRETDGAVIVISSDRTRAAPVSATARRIRAHGGQLLGSVMTKQNKRKFRWPFS